MKDVRIGMTLIQDNGLDRAIRSKANQAWNMKNIANHPHHAEMTKGGINVEQGIARPNDHIMGQLGQEDEHLLCGKTVLVPMGQAQALLIDAILRFEATTASIIGIQSHGKQLSGCWLRGTRPVAQGKECFIGQGKDQHMITPGAILFAGAQGQLARWANIGKGFCDPPDLPVCHFGIRVPCQHGGGEVVRTPPVFDFDQEVISALQGPIDVVIIATATVDAQNGVRSFRPIQPQDCLRRLEQRWQAAIQLTFAVVQQINDNFIIPGGENTPQLAPPAVLFAGKVAFGDRFPCRPAGMPVMSTSNNCQACA